MRQFPCSSIGLLRASREEEEREEKDMMVAPLAHRWNRNPRPQPNKFSKPVFLTYFS